MLALFLPLSLGISFVIGRSLPTIRFQQFLIIFATGGDMILAAAMPAFLGSWARSKFLFVDRGVARRLSFAPTTVKFLRPVLFCWTPSSLLECIDELGHYVWALMR